MWAWLFPVIQACSDKTCCRLFPYFHGQLGVFYHTAIRHRKLLTTVPGYEATTWYGVMVPAKTPKKIIAMLNSQIAQALQSPDVLKMLSRAGFEAESSSPEDFHAFMKAEYEKWSKVIKAAHITAD